MAAETSRAAGATVEFEHVTKRYDAGEKGPGAVNDLSFSMPAGEICVRVGPSGCGKTTSLKMVNRLILISALSLTIASKNVGRRGRCASRRRVR